MAHCGAPLLYMQLVAEVFELLACELGAVVGDQDVGHSESRKDMVFEELDYSPFYDGCNGFCLHPFGIQVYSYYQELFYSRR